MASVDLQALAKEIIRIGVVKSTNPKQCTARVELPDTVNSAGKSMQSFDMKVLQQKTRDDKRYWMPDIDERVLCLFLGNGLSYGFILGSWYWEEDTPPVNSQDKDHTRYKDGTVLEYDRSLHRLTADVKGDVVITATGDITIIATGNTTVDARGKVNVNGSGGVFLNEPGAATVTAAGNCCCAGSCKGEYKNSCCGASPSGNMCCNSSCDPKASTSCIELKDLGNLCLRS